MNDQITIYETIFDIDTDGPMGDGSIVMRFPTYLAGVRYVGARGLTFCGAPAEIKPRTVARSLARRWGLA